MPKTLLSIFACALIIGCNNGKTTKSPPAKVAQVKKQAVSYSEEWADMGMWLPKADQVAFFAANIDITKDVLAEKLSHKNSDIRQRAAYVIEEIGPTANALQKALVTALVQERESLVRIYLCNALRAVGDADEDVLAELRILFQKPGDSKENLEQRIYSGAALATLSKKPDEIAECTAFVCQWLKPPGKELSPSELEKYWDIRWSAVNAVEHMTNARQAIPLLEKLLDEPGKQSWVELHVPRALASLKKTPIEQPKRPSASTKWTPPTNPDPQKILSEAQSDAIAGRYEDALAKHVWFHENSLKISPSLYGVRLSFALSYWKDLAVVYPAAKIKLKEIRDEAKERVTKGENVHESFNDFESINKTLGEEKQTVELFMSLEKSHPKLAAKVFNIAQPALIKAGEYLLCSKHVDPKKDYASYVEMYRVHMCHANDPRFSKDNTSYAQQSFSNEVAILVALLVLSDRKLEAEEIVNKANEVWKDNNFAEQLKEALDGQVPVPWP